MSPKAKALKPALVEITDREGKPAHCSANVQIRLADGRQFSVLSATPSWFEEAFRKSGLRFYFGPAVLFVSSMDMPIVTKAAEEMCRRGDQWLCSYDTPRTTLAGVFAEFKTKHP